MKIAKDYSESTTDAMLYGTAFHTAAEEYVRDNELLPAKFNYAKRALDSLQAKRGEKLCEVKMGPWQYLPIFLV